MRTTATGFPSWSILAGAVLGGVLGCGAAPPPPEVKVVTLASATTQPPPAPPPVPPEPAGLVVVSPSPAACEVSGPIRDGAFDVAAVAGGAPYGRVNGGTATV